MAPQEADFSDPLSFLDVGRAPRERPSSAYRGLKPSVPRHYAQPTHTMKLNTAATVYNAQLPAKKAALMERQLNREAATQRAAPASRVARVPAPAATMRNLSTEPSSRDRLPGLSEGLAEYRRSEGPMSPSRADPPRRPSTGAATRRGQADALAPFGYFTLGPIAAGAFSQVVRARSSGTEALKSGSEVAVKSWTRAKLTRAPHHVQAMKAEVGVLKLLQPSAHTNSAPALGSNPRDGRSAGRNGRSRARALRRAQSPTWWSCSSRARPSSWC